MEDVHKVYQRPLDPIFPVACLDESNKQLVAEARDPIPMSIEDPKKIDDECIRKGAADIFVAVEPLADRRYAALTESRTRIEWASFIKHVLDVECPKAEKCLWHCKSSPKWPGVTR